MDVKNKKIVAITGCAAGIAHTFMAAEGIEQAAKELGAKVKVETHGTAGPDNVLTAKDIREADLVIIAADIAVDKTRFVGKMLYNTDTHLAIADPPKLINEAFEKAGKWKDSLKKSDSSSEVTDTGNIQKEGKVLPHIMYSLSWMVPLVIAGGLVMAIGNMFAMQPGWVTITGLGFVGVINDADVGTASNGVYILQSTLDAYPFLDTTYNVTGDWGGLWWRIPDVTNYVTVVVDGVATSGPEWVAINGPLFEWGKVWSFEDRAFFNTLFSGGAAALSLIYPVIAAGIAYSIAGKITFAPAFLGGWLMNDGNFLGLELDGTPFGTGFLGAIVIGFFVGYLAVAIKKIKVNRTFKGICDLMLWPLLMVLAVVILGRYAFGPVLGMISLWMYQGIIALGDIPGGNILLAAVVAGMICTDLGGPINKTALVAGTAIFLSSTQASMNPNDWNFVPGTATQAAISIPPLIAFASVMIMPKYFTSQEKTLGTNASFMGMVGITEGAIPFAVSKPKAFIPANIVGGMVSGMMVTALGFQFYGGLGSPLAPILGYVPSTVFDSYIVGTFAWIGCYALGVAAGLLVLWGLLALTFKGQKSNRLAGEVKFEANEKVKTIKKEMKITEDQAKLNAMNQEILTIKSKVKTDVSNIKQKTKTENAEFANEMAKQMQSEKAAWETLSKQLSSNLESAKNSSTYDSELNKYKSEAEKIKNEFKTKIEEIKNTVTLDKETKKFKIEGLKEERKSAINEASKLSSYVKAKLEFKDAKKAHKTKLNEINSNYVKNVS